MRHSRHPASHRAQTPSLPERQTLILASASPRRRDLLAQAGLPADRIAPTDISEEPLAGELPRQMATRLAAAKARAAAAEHPGAFILAADTVVAAGRRILTKAEDAAEARRFLKLLSGRRHRVHTGVAILAPDGRLAGRTVSSIVSMKRLSQPEMDAYLATGEWRDKAGAYAIQGRAAAFIKTINGSYTNVVGLPLYETCALLDGLGYRRHAANSD